MLNYKAIEILTSEQARWGTKPLVDAVLQFIRDLKIAARCIVTRGIAGCYENGEMATGRLEILSYNMPVRIYIVAPAADMDRVIEKLSGMVEDGIVVLHDLNVVRHQVKNAFFPRQLRVCDVMTPQPEWVSPESPLSDAAGLLLSSVFTGLPVLDEKRRPIGVITQGDLITRGGLPLRLGLVSESGQDRLESVLGQLDSVKVSEAMTSPAIIIAEDRPLAEAVDLMLARDVKRLPVVDGEGRLTGILSRLDIFRTVMREAPDWMAFTAQKIEVGHLKRVGDILRRDAHAVTPETPVDEVIRIIDDNDIQRVAVVDHQGKLLGLISDRDLLRYFKAEPEGIWRLLSKVRQPFRKSTGKNGPRQELSETTAAMVMTTRLITVQEEMLIEEAIGLMAEKALKRLPVVDEEGRFKGMISRDSLLRTGFAGSV